METNFIFQEKHLARRYDLQKISAFNLGVAEAVQTKLKSKDPEPPVNTKAISDNLKKHHSECNQR